MLEQFRVLEKHVESSGQRGDEARPTVEELAFENVRANKCKRRIKQHPHARETLASTRLVGHQAGGVLVDLVHLGMDVHFTIVIKRSIQIFDATLNPLFFDMFGTVFQNDIGWLRGTGITFGCSDFICCTDSRVDRGAMAAFLVRGLSLEDDGGGNLFNDDDDSIFEGNIDRLAAAGITKGCNPPANDKFCPDTAVNRGAMAAFLVRAMGYADPGGGNLFIDDDDSIFEGDIDRLAVAGVTKGCNPPLNDQFCPTSVVTRGAMAAFLHRALGGGVVFLGHPGSADSANPLLESMPPGTHIDKDYARSANG